jgi:hypothetical protein
MYADHYTENENLFERRLEMRIDAENPVALQGLLDMYANPVVNQLKHSNELKAKNTIIVYWWNHWDERL